MAALSHPRHEAYALARARGLSPRRAAMTPECRYGPAYGYILERREPVRMRIAEIAAADAPLGNQLDRPWGVSEPDSIPSLMERGPARSQATVMRLSALAHESRFAVFRLVAKAGPNGVVAGEVAHTLGAAPNTIAAHLHALSHAGLVVSRRDGRSILYAADLVGVGQLLANLRRIAPPGRSRSGRSSGRLRHGGGSRLMG